MVQDNRAAKNDVFITGIALKSPAPNGELSEYINLPLSLGGAKVSLFGNMSISEGLFQGGLKGFIILNDITGDATRNEALIGGLPKPLSELLKAGSMIKFSFSSSGEGGDPNNVNGLEFYVYNVSIVSNVAPGVIKSGGTSMSFAYRLEFASYEGSALNFQPLNILNDDWVGRIDEFVKIVTAQYMSLAPGETESDWKKLNISNTSQISADKHEIVPTYNGVWFKKNQSLYPWGKEKPIPNLDTLINTCANYAVTAQGFQEDDGVLINRGKPEDNNPSFVFYQSLPQGKWHFLPIGGEQGLITKRYKEGEEGRGRHTYSFTNDETVYKRIEDFRVSSEGDLLDLEQSGAFASQYTLTEPNWKGIYNNIVIDPEADTENCTTTVPAAGSYEASIIGERQNTYYYDFMSISSQLVNENIKYAYDDFFIKDNEGEITSIGPLLGGKLTNGSENPASSGLIETVYGYFDEQYLNKPHPTVNDDYGSPRGQRYMWQTMFDITDLPLYSNEETGEVGIDYVVNTFRKPCKKGKLAYTLLEDLKEQWNRYRYSVCCTSSAPDGFMAMLVGYTAANKLPYDYETDTNRIDPDITPFGLSGATIDNFYRYSFVEVEIWPKALIPQGVSADIFIEGADNTLTYYDYLLSQDINSATGGPHKTYIPGYGGATGITFNYGLGKQTSGEKNYNINQDQEFFVVPVDGGKRGLFTAYNTNELVNNKAFTNTGVNVMGYSYPSGFNLMPIGAMTAGFNPNGSNAIPSTYMGCVVKMDSMREDDLDTIKTEKDFLGNSGSGYTGPAGITGTGCMGVVGLLNKIMGTKNLPNIFGGTTHDITYKEITTDDAGNEVIDTVNVVRDDIDSRPCILDDARPIIEGSEGAPGSLTGITAEPIVFVFSAENDHDGRCT